MITPPHPYLIKIRNALAYRFSLHADQSSFVEIDRNIRDGVEIKGTNLWLLMLAIFIASVGLNVNSTAVIIGAMLISPLMGPIMGVGYGAGINDSILIRRSIGNLLVSIGIALFTSTLYFLVSPLSVAQSELLARTTPSIWDVLIALFGGLAGIIASTRKEKSNVIPGVAIATALMPPLCTAGYGIANGSLEMFFGAFYLFFINSVFIAFATLIVISYIHPPHKRFVSKELEGRVRKYIYIVVVVTILPSIYLAYGLVTREMFNARANEFIKKEVVFENSFIAKQTILPDQKIIELSVVGQKIDSQRLKALKNKLGGYRIPNANLIVHQTVIKELDEATLRKSLLSDVLSNNQEVFDAKNHQILDLKQQLANFQVQKIQQTSNLADQQKIFDEFLAQYPQVQKLAIAKTTEYQPSSAVQATVLLVNVTTNKAFSKEDRRRSTAWLQVRAGVDSVKLIIEK
ncbi:MAG: TIGR00341 family protein [Gallionella sp.]|nr:TIGR00341 family protein [Gallionella sp.]MDD4957847.1 TIGR00341 family protein [Gallionella sp.]